MRAGEIHLPEPTTLTSRREFSEENEELVRMLVELTNSEKVLWKYKPMGKATLTIEHATFEFDPTMGTLWVLVVQGGDFIMLTSLGNDQLSEKLSDLIGIGLQEERAASEERRQKAISAATNILGRLIHGE